MNSQVEAILNLQEQVHLQTVIIPIADRQQADSLHIRDQLLHKAQVEVQPREVIVHQPGVLVQVAVLLQVDQQEAVHTTEVLPVPAAAVHTILRVQEVIIPQGVVLQVRAAVAVLQVHIAAVVHQVHAAAVPQDHHQVDDNYL